MMSCRQCKYFECVDVDTDQWQCGEEVCRYCQGAVQREPQPQDNNVKK